VTGISRTRPDPLDLGRACLDHLATNPAELARFMSIAGYDPQSLRAAVGSRALALGLIDYFAQNEPLMLAACAETGLRPEAFMRVWAAHNQTD
jgi:hypothetical protein